MLWMLDEYETITGAKYPGVITGKPVGMGGSLGRTEATGFGVIFTLREALRQLGIKPEETTASFQGFGNVAQYAIELYNQLGGSVTCVSCWDQTEGKSFSFRRKEGIILDELRKITDRFGGINKEKAAQLGYEVLSGDHWIDQDVDILVPAALENQITAETVQKISSNVKIIAEAANGPTTPAADEVLKQRNVFMIPDFLANAGGVTCSYFEQVQNNMNYYWEKDEVLGKLDVKMTSAFMSVSELALKNKLYMRDAAYIISISRVAEACRQRGWV
jgi:glutamate dehydrogenase (NAD(P)+)